MYPGCGGRSVHRYGTQVSRLVSNSRKVMADFINAKSVNEVVFSRNTTHSINQIAKGISWQEGDVVIPVVPSSYIIVLSLAQGQRLVERRQHVGYRAYLPTIPQTGNV